MGSLLLVLALLFSVLIALVAVANNQPVEVKVNGPVEDEAAREEGLS